MRKIHLLLYCTIFLGIAGCAGIADFERLDDEQEHKDGYLFMDTNEKLGIRLIRINNDLYTEKMDKTGRQQITHTPNIKEKGFFAKNSDYIAYNEYTIDYFLGISADAPTFLGYYLVKIGEDDSKRIKITESEHWGYHK